MLKIGEKIKELRKAQDITQEKLADYLNISYQAVSKWENGLALPDITLLPQLADFFGVSADELLGITNPEQTEELKQYEKQYFSLGRKGKVLDKIELSREVLKKYPRNYQWMINLAYALVSYGATKEQLDVWATGKENFEEWNRSLQEHYSIVAVDNENIVGFGDIDKDGYIDRLFVRAGYQGRGIATAICDQLEKNVEGKITTDASITAKPFFEKRGYKVIKRQEVERKGVFLTNFVMKKDK